MREQPIVRHDGRPREHPGQIARRNEGRARRAEVGRRREPPGRSGAGAAGKAHAARRERRPADVAVARAPGDPGRTPHGSRNPAPAAGARDPAAVVKRRPTPVPVRDPGPAVLGQRPVAARRVGREAGADDRRARRPDVAVAAVVVPPAVWRERCLKLGVGLRRRSRRRSSARCRCRGRGRLAGSCPQRSSCIRRIRLVRIVCRLRLVARRQRDRRRAGRRQSGHRPAHGAGLP